MPRSKPGNESKVSLPITPMLDMTFQLLFFFITSFNPADQEGQIDMALPASGPGLGQVNPADAPVEFPGELTVKVRTQHDGINDGEISALLVRDLEGAETPIEDGLTGLANYLATRRAQTKNRDAVKVEADGSLRVRHLAKVLDACRKAGFENVGLVAPADPRR